MYLKPTQNNKFKNYILNCILLLLPILIWNIIFISQLPDNYQPKIFLKGIPKFIIYGENVLRILLFAIAYCMTLSIHSKRQRLGLYIYLSGLLLYFLSWVLLVHFSNSWWANSFIGFSAPAFTPALWLFGIALIGNSFYIRVPFHRFVFIIVSILFLIFHITHTILVFMELS
ncbi:hypothetical protein D3C87_666190 [compost metagenome]